MAPRTRGLESGGGRVRTLREAALEYARRGLWVFPLGAGSKVPLVPKDQDGRGFLDASVDVRQVNRWWSAHPEANVGLWPGRSGLIAFDMDTPEARQAAHVCGLLAEPVPVVETPHGQHLYFR